MSMLKTITLLALIFTLTHCQDCTPYSNCSTCSDTACTVCNTQFYLDATPACAPCSDTNCDTCDNDTCSVCNSTYYLNAGVCTGCTDQNCDTCDNDTCSDCSGDYLLNTAATLCVVCSYYDTNCTACDTVSCTQCPSNYYLVASNALLSQCEACTNYDPQCITCSDSQCLDCSTGYELQTESDGTTYCTQTPDIYEYGCQSTQFSCDQTGDLAAFEAKFGFDTTNPEILAIPGIAPAEYCLGCRDNYFLQYYNDNANGYAGFQCCACDLVIDHCKVCNATSFDLTVTPPTTQVTCSQCDTGFVTGTDTEGNSVCVVAVTECSTYALDGTCDECNSGYTGSECCNVNCDSCTSTEYDACLSCKIGQFVDSASTCQNCGQFCDRCQNADQCDVCDADHFLNNGQCTCFNGYFLNLANDQCTHCHKTCLSCAGPEPCTGDTADDTQQCNVGFHSNGNYSYICQKVCQQGQLFDLTISDCTDNGCDTQCGLCKLYSQNCMTCSNPDYFLVPHQDDYRSNYCCEYYDQFYDRSSSSCECYPGYFIDSTVNNACSECNSNCNTCVTLSTTCLTCNGDYVLEGTQCEQACNDGYYPDSNSVCRACDASCATCTGPNTSDCLTCLGTGTSIDLQDGSCLAQCDPNYYTNTSDSANPICQLCDTTCATCSGTANTDCSTCISGLFQQGTTCLDRCDDTYYADASSICQSCTSPCQNCDTSATSCTSCPTSGTLLIYLQSNSCVASCGDGYYADSTNTCQTCDASCTTCNVSATYCLSCAATTPLFNNICVTDCPLAYFNASNVCTACSSNCKTCTDATTCSICLDGYWLDATACSACDPSCQTCSTAAATCLSCSNSADVLQGSTCQTQCDATYYNNSGTCAACAATCANCSDANTCTTCPAGQYLQGPACGAACDTGFTADANGVCQANP